MGASYRYCCWQDCLKPACRNEMVCLDHLIEQMIQEGQGPFHPLWTMHPARVAPVTRESIAEAMQAEASGEARVEAGRRYPDYKQEPASPVDTRLNLLPKGGTQRACTRLNLLPPQQSSLIDHAERLSRFLCWLIAALLLAVLYAQVSMWLKAEGPLPFAGW